MFNNYDDVAKAIWLCLLMIIGVLLSLISQGVIRATD